MLEAYYDASERESGIFCVSGFAFGADNARKAHAKWERLWGDTTCHMTDWSANPPCGEFKGWTPDKTSDFMKQSIAIMNMHASFAVAVSVDMADIAALAPISSGPESKRILYGFRTAYAVCCHFAMASLAKMSGNSGIAYFFERGDAFQNESQSFMDLVTSVPDGKSLYKWRSHAVMKAEECRLFEMADMLAWEWAKHAERHKARSPLDENGLTKMRTSLMKILGDELAKKGEVNLRSTTRRAWHISRENLEKYFASAKDAEMFTDQPSQHAMELMASWRE